MVKLSFGVIDAALRYIKCDISKIPKMARSTDLGAMSGLRVIRVESGMSAAGPVYPQRLAAMLHCSE